MGRKSAEQIRQQAGQDMVILLENWKRQKSRRRKYRISLGLAMMLSCVALLCVGYFSLYQKVPSVIRIKAGTQQSLDLGLPMTAKVVAVSDQGESNIPRGSVTIDLSSAVTLNAEELDQYRMDVKLFGWIPFKEVGIQVIEEQELIPVGVPVGIYVETDGILVIGVGEFTGEDGGNCSPARYILKSGDYIRKLNGEAVGDKDTFIRKIEEGNGEEVILTIERNDQIMEVKVQPRKNQNGEYKIGVWVRDNAQGIGTLTYIDADGNFGALGHGINDVDTSTLMEIDDGSLYQTQIVSIKRGEDGDPGEMTGMIIYTRDRILGDITQNSPQGIFGTCNQKVVNLATADPLPVGLKQEIQKGSAWILCTVDDTPQYFEVEIQALHLDQDHINRGIELKVTDRRLLEKTGGIVQGMSGAPIIQNGKIVGAVTHVLVNDPTRGYGIFIENMLEHYPGK